MGPRARCCWGPSEKTWSVAGSNVTEYVPSVTPISALLASVGANGERASEVVTCFFGAADVGAVESVPQALEATTMPEPRTTARIRARFESFMGRYLFGPKPGWRR